MDQQPSDERIKSIPSLQSAPISDNAMFVGVDYPLEPQQNQYFGDDLI